MSEESKSGKPTGDLVPGEELDSEGSQVFATRQPVEDDPSRVERRTARRTVRRRRAMARLWYAVIPVVAVIGLIVVLLALFGGEERGTTETTLEAGPASGSGLLIIERADSALAMVLMRPKGTDGLILGMPGTTLLKTPGGFQTLTKLHESGKHEDLEAALTGAFEVEMGPIVTIQWNELWSALMRSGVGGTGSLQLSVDGESAGEIASAFLGLVGTSDSDSGAQIWAELELEGDISEFRAAVDAVASLMSTGEWVAMGLEGRLVEGPGFQYFEGEVSRARALLAASTLGLPIRVQVQNGSGAVGVAESAAAQLEPLGYQVVPSGNSADFPDVKYTRISVPPDLAAEGARVRAVLGVGAIIQDDTLVPGNMLVIIGKDYAPPSTTETEPTG